MADQTNTNSEPGQSATRTNAAQRGNASSITRRSASRLETAPPVRGDCCALSGLLGLFVSRTQGGAIARKTRGRFPWADMLRPLRGKETRGSVSRWLLSVLRGHDRKTFTALPNRAARTGVKPSYREAVEQQSPVAQRTLGYKSPRR